MCAIINYSFSLICRGFGVLGFWGFGALDEMGAVRSKLPDLEPGRVAEMLRHAHAGVGSDRDAYGQRTCRIERLGAHSAAASGFSSVDCRTTVV